MASAQPAVIDRSGMDFEEERIALVCAFRWAARFDMHEAVANHFSLAVDETGTKFLMNPRGRHFSRIKASELLLLDAEVQHERLGRYSNSTLYWLKILTQRQGVISIEERLKMEAMTVTVVVSQ